jgi:DNA-binding PadR family transcriptional regulator
MSKTKKELFNQCPCVGATLDKLIQPALLAILSKGPLHGYELARQVGEIPDFLHEPPDISGVYRMLKALESRGMVVSGWDVSEKGRAKNLFTITDNGLLCLQNWHRTLQNYRKAIDSLLETTRKSIKHSSK